MTAARPARSRCGVSTDDLGFFFEPAHATVAAAARAAAVEIAGEAPGSDNGPAHTAVSGDERAKTRALVARLGAAGLLDVCVPERDGGRATRRPGKLDVRALCLVRECLAWASGLADTAFAMQGLGSYPIALAGTEAQRAEWLPGVRAGTTVAAFAITEPEAGSDVGSMRATARRDGDGYILEGEKCLISNAGVADMYVTFAKTDASSGSRGVSAFVVRADDPGFVHARSTPAVAEHPLGDVRFDAVRLPASRRLGDEGAGFRVAMATLDVFRSTVGAAACGIARRALDETLDRVQARCQFGKPLGDFQLTRAAVAQMATSFDAARLMVYRAAHEADTRDGRVSREAAMAKMYATEAAQGVVDRAVQLHGGAGVLEGSVTERLYREVRPLRIYEGTTEIQQLVIAASLLDRA